MGFADSAKPQADRSRRRRRFTLRRVLLAAALLLTTAIGTTVYSLLKAPAWYQPIAIRDDAAQQRVRNNLINAEQAFTQSLLVGRPFVYHIYQDDLNRWLAMRKEIYARIDDLFPPIVIDPFIVIENDRILLSGRAKRSGVEAVLSLEVAANYDEGSIVLTARTLRCGLVPIPIDAADLKLDFPVEADPGETWPGSPAISGSLARGLRIGSRATWRNGGVEYEVTGLSAVTGRLDLSITPLGRQANRRRDQWEDDDWD